VPYVDVGFIQNILRDEFTTYPQNLDDYLSFAQTVIDARLVGLYDTPFDDTAVYPDVPMLIQWIAAYLVAYKLFDAKTSIVEGNENSAGQRWWDMADSLLGGIVDGAYLLHLADGTVIVGSGSTNSPRFYPSGVREKAPSAENIPYFSRDQATNW